ncbi:hypothetical protein L6452_09660 [Arctium lappa]|uniref:Uncharacterized protein n=1 Tax=Arctium lappa TaxID=4217 RepID=A0ACB9DKM0_ARCLA|nr:hypothetical protein L6452_09660 [Arctium lappa]
MAVANIETMLSCSSFCLSKTTGPGLVPINQPFHHQKTCYNHLQMHNICIHKQSHLPFHSIFFFFPPSIPNFNN